MTPTDTKTLPKVLIQDISAFKEKEVLLQGWVYQKRTASKKLAFLILRDGTGWIQGVLHSSETPPEVFQVFETLTQESAVLLTGTVRADPRSPCGFELSVRKLTSIHQSEPYPISPKEHGIEFLMDHRHLWIRSQKQWATLRIRSFLLQALEMFFHQNGFIRFDAPILTPTACEGTSTLFETTYFDQKAYLTQSGQLYEEVGAFAFQKCYVLGPTFRAEKSKTRKHLTEFWMIEPEIAFANLEDVIDLAQKCVCFAIQFILEKAQPELKILKRDQTLLKTLKTPFEKITYQEARVLLEKKGIPLPDGEDFGSPHETALGAFFQKPVFVTHFPSQIKAFYFKHTPDNQYALGCDLIAPEGYGEIIGGGEREHDLEKLKKYLNQYHLPQKDYEWYLDLRRFGSVPHGGFGLGIERTVAWICGSSHVRETIPFPRMLNHLKP